MENTENSKIETIDITPDKSIYHKIGEANYSISDAIAELVDNSIDATNDEGVEIHIVLNKKDEKITIEDNGKGMSKEVASKSLVLAHSKKHDALGEFGLGLKSACTSLGTVFSITSTPEGSEERYTLEYNKEKFLQSSDWHHYPLAISKAQKNEHGTKIEISHLKVKLYDALVTRLKDDLAKRYGPYIEHNHVVIKVGLKRETAKPCIPSEVKLVDGLKKEFSFMLTKGSMITGWYGLFEVGSQKQSGFNMFRRGRLIRASEKLGYNYHPNLMSITGDINLDSVPVTHNKREFIVESSEFKEFIEKFWGDQTEKYLGYKIKGKMIDEITKLARDRSSQEKADDNMPTEKKETIKNNLLNALNRIDEFKELAYPDLYQAKKRSSKGVEDLKEARESDLRVAREEEVKPTEEERNQRTPKKTQPKTAKFIMVGGKKFKFDFFLKNLANDTIDKETIINQENVVEIYINTGFKGYSLTKDTDYYSTHHIAEAIAELYVKETNQKIERVFELRNSLIYGVASLIYEEEEYKRLEKSERELTAIAEKKREIEGKRSQTSLKAK
ncbi:MAG: ATP-binding protein [Candidatus Pacebacteria bacterium]|nr:ATP-binding protein [Candidatus Paceibacterota bacterium]